MKKIAIIRCLDSSLRCTGSGCMSAWNQRDKAFSRYAGQDISLEAFLNCNGCDCDPAQDEAMIRKLDRLKKMGVEVVHTGGCTIKDKEHNHYCPNMEKIVAMLHDRGIQTVPGTHKVRD